MLKQRAFVATFWSAVDVAVRQGLSFVVSLVLARLLSPEEFGTIAVLYVFMGVAQAFVDSGFSAALVQAKDVTQTDESTVFWFNAGVGAVVAGALASAGPLLAHAFAAPVLRELSIAMGLNVFIAGLGSVHSTLLSKRLDFSTQMRIGVVSTLLSGGAAIYLARTGHGVWALVGQIVVASTANTIGLWVATAWRPTFVFSSTSARRLFRYGGYMLASSLLEVVYSRFYTVLIGRQYGLRELGFYNRADTTRQLPAGVLASVLSRVAVPVFAAAQDGEQLRRGVRLGLRSMMLINAPAMLGMAAVAEPLTESLFGSQWLPSVPALRVLCLAGMLWPLHVLNLNALLALGHSKVFFRLEVWKKIVGAALFAVGATFGVMGIAWSQVVFGVIGFFINASQSRRVLGYPIAAQLRDTLPIVAVSAVMAAAVATAAALLVLPPALELGVLIGAGALLFLSTCWLLRVEALGDVLSLVRRRANVSEKATT